MRPGFRSLVPKLTACILAGMDRENAARFVLPRVCTQPSREIIPFVIFDRREKCDATASQLSLVRVRVYSANHNSVIWARTRAERVMVPLYASSFRLPS